MDYVRALAKDPIARKVKLADLRHNLDARRLNGVRSGKYDLYLQAVRYLEKSGIEHFYAELSAWYQRSGLPLKKFFNTSGLLYKSMELKDKLPDMSEDEMLRLLATDGMLVKRPLLVGDDFVLVGFKETEWAEHLKNK